MIYLGTIQSLDKAQAVASVRLSQLDTTVPCRLLHAATGQKKTLNLPNVGDQVAVIFTDTVQIVLGSVYSQNDAIPSNDLTIEAPTVPGAVKLSALTVDLGAAGMCSIKNGTTSLQSLFNDLATLLQKATLTTPAGLGTLSPNTLAALTLWQNNVKTLLT